MTTTMSPEAQAAAARALAGEAQTDAERPVVAELRQELLATGSYDDAADMPEMESIFEEHVFTAREFVAEHSEADADEDAITAEEAVDVLMDIGKPVVDDIIESEVAKSGVKTPVGKEAGEKAARESFRDQLIDLLTPEATDGDTPEGDGTPEADPIDAPERSFSAGVWDKLASAKDRFSLTFKETRADYRHYKETQKAIRTFDPGSQERKSAVRDMREAKIQYRSRVGRTFGVVAVAGFAAQQLQSKGLDIASYANIPSYFDQDMGFRAVVVGAAAPAAAVGYEWRQMREGAKDKSLKAQMLGLEVFGKVMRGVTSGWRKQGESINYKKLAKKDPELYKEHKDLKTELEEEDAELSKWEEQFDHGEDENYQARAEAYDERLAELQEMEAELQEQYGKRGLSTKAKVVLGVGAAAATAYLAYRFSQDGIPFTGGRSGNGVEHAPTGNNSNNGGQAAAESTPPTTGRTTPPTTGGSGSGAAEQAPQAPTKPSGLTPEGSQNWDNLSRDEQIRFNNAWKDMDSQERGAFNIYTSAPAEQVEALHNGMEAIREAHPNASPEEFNRLVADTLNLAAMREEYIGDGWGPTRWARAMQFDEMFKRYIESQKSA